MRFWCIFKNKNNYRFQHMSLCIQRNVFIRYHNAKICHTINRFNRWLAILTKCNCKEREKYIFGSIAQHLFIPLLLDRFQWTSTTRPRHHLCQWWVRILPKVRSCVSFISFHKTDTERILNNTLLSASNNYEVVSGRSRGDLFRSERDIKVNFICTRSGEVSSQKRIIQTILEEKLRDAEKLGAKSESIEHLKKLFLRFQDVFWVKFVADPPVAVAPLKVQLKEGSTPIMVKSRQYPPSHKDYLKKHLSELVDHNLV